MKTAQEYESDALDGRMASAYYPTRPPADYDERIDALAGRSVPHDGHRHQRRLYVRRANVFAQGGARP